MTRKAHKTTLPPTAYCIGIVTPIADDMTPQQWERFEQQQLQLQALPALAEVEFPRDKFTVNQWCVTGSANLRKVESYLAPSDSANTTLTQSLLVYANVDQTSRRQLALDRIVNWLEARHAPKKLAVWLDADDVPTAYWLQALRQCNHAFNVLAVTRPGLVMFSDQYKTAGRDAFKRLKDGACGVGCGSAIAWRYDLAKSDKWLLAQLKLNNVRYHKYCGIEDVVLAIEVAQHSAYDCAYVTADCCNDNCGGGNPAIYHLPSYELGNTDRRAVRNQLLADYRHYKQTAIQGVDGGYGSNLYFGL